MEDFEKQLSELGIGSISAVRRPGAPEHERWRVSIVRWDDVGDSRGVGATLAEAFTGALEAAARRAAS